MITLPIQEIAVQFVYSKQQKMKKTFYLKNDKGKLLEEVIIFTFLDRVATVDVLTASNTGVKVVGTRTVHFAGLKLSPSFERWWTKTLTPSPRITLKWTTPLNFSDLGLEN